MILFIRIVENFYIILLLDFAMLNSQIKQKRQIEILGLVILKPKYYKTFDLANIFDCDDITIKRDLKELRSLGISIHSVPKKGIVVENQLSEIIMEQLVNQFSIYTYLQKEFNKANHFLITKLQQYAVAYLSILQLAIEKKIVLNIKYQKFNSDEISNKEIEPILLYQSESEWRVYANNNNWQKTFLVSRIKSIELTDKNFEFYSHVNVKKIFDTSFRSWISNNKTNVKLLFQNSWKRKKVPQVMVNQKHTQNSDGSLIYEFNVNSLNEIAQWIAGLGSGVKVIEPPELKKIVIKIANETLSNYL